MRTRGAVIPASLLGWRWGLTSGLWIHALKCRGVLKKVVDCGLVHGAAAVDDAVSFFDHGMQEVDG